VEEGGVVLSVMGTIITLLVIITSTTIVTLLLLLLLLLLVMIIAIAIAITITVLRAFQVMQVGRTQQLVVSPTYPIYLIQTPLSTP